MLILDTPGWWFGAGAGDLHFVSFVGWLMCAVLATGFCPAREAGPPKRPRAQVLVWVAVAVAFLLHAVSAGFAVLALNHRGPAFVEEAIRCSQVASGVGTLILLAVVPAPVPTGMHLLWRVAASLAATVPLALLFVFCAAQPVAAAIIHGGLGLWLLAGGTPGRPFADVDLPAPVITRIFGGVLLTAGLAAAAAVALHAPRMVEAIRGGLFAIGACLTCAGLWWLYLQYRTLPRVRERRGVFKLRPLQLLPFLQLVVLIVGLIALRVTVRQAEGSVSRQLVNEVRAVSSTLTWPRLPPGPAGAQAGPLREKLEALLAASPAYRAGAVWQFGASDPLLVAAAGAATGSSTELLPRTGIETEATRAGGSVVRWKSPVTTDGFLLVLLPLGPGEGPWRLSVLVDTDALAEVIVGHRLQGFVIVALLALITGFAVLTIVRSLNETELRVLKDQADLENQARNELLAMVSHEVRTPLQSVIGYAELAATQPLPAPAARHVQAIRGQAAALLRIIQDILDLSALRSGRLLLQPEPVALRALAGEVHQAFAERARRKGLTLTVTVDDAVPAVVIVDRVRLLQVLLNLVGNAIKFTAHGRVRLTIARVAAADDAAPDAAPAAVRLAFRVDDTGPGIPARQLGRVFEPFRKLRDDAPAGGVGLGLAICEQIVASLQGRINVSSTEGAGTTFGVELTLAVASPAALAEAAGAAEASGPPSESRALAGLRVLVVDDHPYVRDLLRDFLQRVAATVVASADGASALAAVARATFDVVLLDLKLPDRTPSAMLAGLRPDPARPHEPWIIGLSAGATEQEVQDALDHGMNDFLLKPVSMTGLVETLRMSPAGAKIVPASAPSEPGEDVAIDPRAATPQERTELLAEAAPAIVRIAHACHIGDVDRAAAEAHFLANSCLVLGLTRAHAICRAIETAAGQEHVAAARDALDELRAEISHAHAAEVPAAPEAHGPGQAFLT